MLIAGAASGTGGIRKRLRQTGKMKYVLHVIASALYFALVGCVSLAPMVGDCFASPHHVCPTDADRNHTFFIIWVAGLLIYFPLGWFLLRRENRN